MIIKLLLPQACIMCNDLTHRDRDLCISCENDLPFLKQCTNSLILPNMRIFTLFNYEEPIQQLILGLKFGNRLINAKIIADLFADYLDEQYKNQNIPQVIIPIPLHYHRLKERGYNQALELAKPIAKRLNIPIDKSSAIRTKNTKAQAQLATKERTQNIKKAFAINFDKLEHYNHIAVLDDVITTGSTATEFCKILFDYGINKIDVFCSAKAKL